MAEMLQLLPPFVLHGMLSTIDSITTRNFSLTCSEFHSDALWKKIYTDFVPLPVTIPEQDTRENLPEWYNPNRSYLKAYLAYMKCKERGWNPIEAWQPSKPKKTNKDRASYQFREDYMKGVYEIPVAIRMRVFGSIPLVDFEDDDYEDRVDCVTLCLISPQGDIIEILYYFSAEDFKIQHWLMISRINGTRVSVPMYLLSNDDINFVDGNIEALMAILDVKFKPLGTPNPVFDYEQYLQYDKLPETSQFRRQAKANNRDPAVLEFMDGLVHVVLSGAPHQLASWAEATCNIDCLTYISGCYYSEHTAVAYYGSANSYRDISEYFIFDLSPTEARLIVGDGRVEEAYDIESGPYDPPSHLILFMRGNAYVFEQGEECDEEKVREADIKNAIWPLETIAAEEEEAARRKVEAKQKSTQKALATIAIPDDLASLKRAELQKLCKEHRIPANIKNVDMISRLRELKLSGMERLKVSSP